jgi:general secretion pathway protein G
MGMSNQAEADGFTLIELLIVIVILGILATIVIFASGAFTSNSKSGACNANAKIMNTAEAAYAAQHPGSFAHGDTTKLAALIADPLPISGAGAVKWDTGIGAWDCA